ncbi:hypothetical protein BMS3Bbin01_01273 [bacterium BMS3Bbin01]|nr:hypothetical protein BMS3Bbin01_01273 [bacterium BMS3Bbin01]
MAVARRLVFGNAYSPFGDELASLECVIHTSDRFSCAKPATSSRWPGGSNNATSLSVGWAVRGEFFRRPLRRTRRIRSMLATGAETAHRGVVSLLLI